MSRKAGFTLIELLVVIGIIAILAGILFPVFSRARAKAQQTQCLSNVRQLATAELEYANDYNEKFAPGWVPDPENPNERIYHFTILQPYIRNYQILYCPTEDRWRGYGYHKTLLAEMKINKINKPAETLMLVDAAIISPDTINDPPELWEEAGSPNWEVHFPYMWSSDGDEDRDEDYYRVGDYAPRRPMPRHDNGCNVAFVDGHAAWMNIHAIIDPLPGSRECIYDN